MEPHRSSERNLKENIEQNRDLETKYLAFCLLKLLFKKTISAKKSENQYKPSKLVDKK